MDSTINHDNTQVQSSENIIDIGGYPAVRVPGLLPDGQILGDAKEDERDTGPLAKLWSTGMDVPSLRVAYEKYQIAHVRDPEDIWKLLGYTSRPSVNGKFAFTLDAVTALAFLYPLPHEPGKVYPYTDYVRIRPAVPTAIREKQGASSPTHKYLQPAREHTATHSEPYFLMDADTWTRIMSPEFPLYITEGECKAIALGVAGLAGLGFPGAQMMYASKKQGKNHLHPSLDPDGPRKGKTIPIRDRDIYIVPDSDFADNKDVKLSFKMLVRNLTIAGASPDRIKLIQIPPPAQMFAKTGIDDLFFERAGPRWGGNEEKVADIRGLMESMCEAARNVNTNEYLYSATSHVRGADRLMERFDQPNKYIGTIQAGEGTRHNLWAMYNCDHYILHPINLPLNNTSTKMAFKSVELSQLAHEIWDEGVKLAAQEEDQDAGAVVEMNADYPNRLFGLVHPYVPAKLNESLIEPFEGVDVNDICLRIQGGLINVTKAFQGGVDWSRRTEWLLPPNHRWFGTGQIPVSLTNVTDEPACPIFTRLIDNMFEGDAEVLRILQMSVGKIILSPMFLDHNRFLALYGIAGSGKSTLTNLIINLLGVHDVAVLRSNFGGRFDTSGLPGKRLILFPENEDGSDHYFTPEMTATIKKVTGRDMLTIEPKGMQPYSARIDAEILVVGNAPPAMEMDPDAFKRRAVFLKAVNKIGNPDSGISRHRMETEEMAGILLWALRGACRLYKGEPYATPEPSQEDVLYSVLNVCPEQRFVQTMVVEKEEAKLYVSELEDHYRNWLRHNRFPAKEPGWGKLTGAIREKFGDLYRSVPSKDKLRRSTRMYKGLAVNELMY